MQKCVLSGETKTAWQVHTTVNRRRFNSDRAFCCWFVHFQCSAVWRQARAWCIQDEISHPVLRLLSLTAALGCSLCIVQWRRERAGGKTSYPSFWAVPCKSELYYVCPLVKSLYSVTSTRVRTKICLQRGHAYSSEATPTQRGPTSTQCHSLVTKHSNTWVPGGHS